MKLLGPPLCGSHLEPSISRAGACHCPATAEPSRWSRALSKDGRWRLSKSFKCLAPTLCPRAARSDRGSQPALSQPKAANKRWPSSRAALGGSSSAGAHSSSSGNSNFNHHQAPSASPTRSNHHETAIAAALVAAAAAAADNNDNNEDNESIISRNTTATTTSQRERCTNNDVTLDPAESGPIGKLLARYYRLESTPGSLAAALDGPQESPPKQAGDTEMPRLPRPSNVTVLIISWYPPTLKLSWNLNELEEAQARKLDFYQTAKGTGGATVAGAASNDSDGRPSRADPGELDLELAIERGEPDDYDPAGQLGVVGSPQAPESPLEELRRRRLLVRKSLSCFQVTYNIVNSR